MTAKCLMLDVDGVLVNGRPSDGRFWTTGLQQDLGLSPDLLIEYFFKADWTDVVTGKKKLLPTLRHVLQNIAPGISAQDLVKYWFEMDSHIIRPVLSDLRAARKKGLPVFLATNQDHMRADYLMRTMKLQNEVDGIVYSARAGCQKPDPDFFAFAQRETGFPAHDLLLVDDTKANIHAARASGWSAAHWDGTSTLSDIIARVFGKEI